jgi:SAM-dependent methyltransferase
VVVSAWEHPVEARREAARLAGDGRRTDWFEQLYAAAAGDPQLIPWADGAPNPHLARWLEREGVRGDGRRATVVACGLGDDAELLARLGFAVVAFDLSPSAIEWCRRRFPASPVDYRQADLLALPLELRGGGDLVVEVYTLQSLGAHLREPAVRAIASLVAPGGSLVVVTRGREDGEEAGGGPPWPVARSELQPLDALGFATVSWDDFHDEQEPPKRRFVGHFRAPSD